MSIKQIVIIIVLVVSNAATAQYDVEKAKKDTLKKNNSEIVRQLKENTYVGSGFNLLLGNQLFIYASPQIGYEFIPKLSAGFLSLLQYNRIANFNISETYTAFGGGIFTRYKPFDFLILETSFNLYKIKYSFTGQAASFETNAKSWMVGIGYSRNMGRKSYLNFLLSYDLLRDQYNPEISILNLNDFRLYYKFGIILYPFR